MAKFSIKNWLKWGKNEVNVSLPPTGERPNPIIPMGVALEKCAKFDAKRSILWAHALYEIFAPIDMCADKACNVRYIKVDDNGRELPFNIFEQKFMQKVNDLTSFTQFLYNYSFNLMASGNAFIHVLKTGKYPNYANVLNSDLLLINQTNSDGGIVVSKDNNVLNYSYNGYSIAKRDMYYSCYLPETFDNDYKRGLSPLKMVEKNINLLLSVYSARYNVYANNGMAGIITKKAANENAFEAALDPVTQKRISDELLETYSLDRLNNIKAISSIPLDFIKTLATISELEPFREVQADAIAIAAIYGVKKELLGRESDTTFNNQRDAERFLWQNTIKSVCFDICEMLESVFSTENGQHIIPKLDEIEVLQDDELTKMQILEKKVAILEKISEKTGNEYKENFNNFANKL